MSSDVLHGWDVPTSLGKLVGAGSVLPHQQGHRELRPHGMWVPQLLSCHFGMDLRVSGCGETSRASPRGLVQRPFLTCRSCQPWGHGMGTWDGDTLTQPRSGLPAVFPTWSLEPASKFPWSHF